MTHPLLTPRYMVEADYPNSPFRVGQILYVDAGQIEENGELYMFVQTEHDSAVAVSDYPHIFRHMHWSEGRALSELPRWVVANLYTKNRVYPVEYSVSDGHIFIRVVGDIEWSDLETACKDWNLTPVTEAEYLEYLKSKEK